MPTYVRPKPPKTRNQLPDAPAAATLTPPSDPATASPPAAAAFTPPSDSATATLPASVAFLSPSEPATALPPQAATMASSGSGFTTGHDGLDEMLQDSIDSMVRDAEMVAESQFALWSHQSPPEAAIPYVKTGADFAKFEEALLIFVNRSDSAAVFTTTPAETFDEGVRRSRIYGLKHRWWTTALRQATAPDAAKKTLTEPHQLLAYITDRFAAPATTPIISVTRQLREFRRAANEPLQAYYARLATLHTETLEAAAAADPKAFVDNVFKAIALLNLGPESAAADWLTERADQPFQTLLNLAVKANAVTAAISSECASSAASVPRCTFCRRRGHVEKDCRDKKRRDAKGKGKAEVNAVATSGSEPGKNEAPLACVQFLCDSGSPIHITQHREHFASLRPPPRSRPKGPTGEPIPVEGVGDLLLHQPSGGRSLLLRDVYLAPTIGTNIVSVQALEQQGYTVVWGKHPGPVRVSHKGLPAANFYRTSSGYYGNFRPDSPGVNAITAGPSASIWHRRFGHIHHDYVRKSAGHGLPKDTEKCPACAMSKPTRHPGKARQARADAPFVRLCVDLGGGQQAFPPGVAPGLQQPAKYFLLATDDHTRYRWVIPLAAKADAPEALVDLLKRIKTEFGKDVAYLRSDGGREFDNKVVRAALKSHGTTWEPTGANSPEQNGISERSMRTLGESVRAMLMDSAVPPKYWPYALEAAVHIWNRTTTTFDSPHQRLYGERPSVDHLRVYGCLAYALNGLHKAKLDPRAQPMVHLGYVGTNVYVLLNPATDRVVRRRDVTFDESKFFAWPGKPQLPETVDDGTVQVAVHALEGPTNDAAKAEPTAPASYKAAMATPHAQQWHNAMTDELAQHAANGTWTEVPQDKLPSGSRVLPGKWVLRQKANGAFKARWVVCGNREDISLEQTYAATLPATTARMLFAYAAAKGLTIRQADVSTAFLNAPLDRDVYVRQPTGFGTKGTVCKLRRALYGLRSAPRSWFQTLSAYLQERGFLPCPCDPCLWRRDSILLTVYVDDLLVVGPDPTALDATITDIAKRFKIKQLGTPSTYLGMEVKTGPDGTIRLSQSAKIAELVAAAGLSACVPRPTPLDHGTELPIPLEPKLPDAEASEYRSLVGKAMHIACTTRPDIMLAVNSLAQCSHAPSQPASNALRHLVRYLKGTASLALSFAPGAGQPSLSLYSDANWASKGDSRSTSGVVLCAHKTPVLWYAKRQLMTARSTCEAEFLAADLACREAVWARALWAYICDAPTATIPLHVDNQSAIFLAQKEDLRARNRHYLIRHETVRESELLNITKVCHLPGTEQPADGFTKLLPGPAHKDFVQRIALL